MPEGHPVASEGEGLDVQVRHLSVGLYRLLFTVRGDRVLVLHVRHGNRRAASAADLRSALGELEDLA